jgi:hypothetical protein
VIDENNDRIEGNLEGKQQKYESREELDKGKNTDR